MNYIPQNAYIGASSEGSSLIRLILQRPTDGVILLARYDSEDHHWRFKQSCIAENHHAPNAKIKSKKPIDSFWACKGFKSGHVIAGETMADAVARLAYRQLGISLQAVQHVCSLEQQFTFGAKRHYFYSDQWDGDLLDTCDPDRIYQKAEVECSGLHEWVQPLMLDTYLYHPEVVYAMQCAHTRFRFDRHMN